jgi:hypothetical protein
VKAKGFFPQRRKDAKKTLLHIKTELLILFAPLRLCGRKVFLASAGIFKNFLDLLNSVQYSTNVNHERH